MVIKKTRCLLRLLALLSLCSCAPTRGLVYFNDLKEKAEYTETVRNKVAPVIQPDDILSITMSSLNPESNTLFNNGVLQPIGSGGTSSDMVAYRPQEGYLVDKNGAINFPVLGSIALAGLTKEEAIGKLTSEIKKSVKNPIVNVRFLNFRITVIGEVNHPSTFTIPSERITLIEAIALAGDLTAYGKRENILVIKEKSGIRSASRVNLTSKDILDSPSFYLQQNDVVYVEPVKSRALQSSQGNFYLPIASLVVSVLSVLLLALR